VSEHPYGEDCASDEEMEQAHDPTVGEGTPLTAPIWIPRDVPPILSDPWDEDDPVQD
jgi:hypothetical protein